jgi:RHH-type rel operon transcriptional repressor/antitoxin RelB
MNTHTFSVRLNPASKARLLKLAKSTGRSRAFLAAEAIEEYLDMPRTIPPRLCCKFRCTR